MKIAQLTPGSGDNFYCENCLRDVNLVKAMRNQGHEVLMIPMYLPVSSENTETVSNAPIFFGGINVYLQQKMDFFRKTPRWFDSILDSRWLLNLVGKKSGMTSARLLGEMTVSMLRGEDGRQVKELDRLVDWMVGRDNRPDIVCISNILLAGLAGPIRERLKVPVVCLLQDEDGFLDGLEASYSAQAWQIVAEKSRDIDAFVSVSRYFADVMQKRLSVEDEKIHVVYTGISMDGFESLRLNPEVPTIGYLSRMCPERGLDNLVDAYILLKKNDKLANVKLRIAGGKISGDEAFVRGLKRKLASAGIIDDVEFMEGFQSQGRISFLRGLSVLSVPEKNPIAYGLYVLESLAAGVPVVEPAGGVFDELSTETGGCVLYEPNDAAALCESLSSLLLNPERLRQLGTDGKDAVIEKFDVQRTAVDIVRIFDVVAGKF